MTSWEPEWAKTPEFRREMARLKLRHAIAEALTGWLRLTPWVGKYVADFWYLLIAEGVRSTLKPRWGGITFAYLNDGIKPTVWHTWRQITHDQTDPYTGIYTTGAPRSLAQAREWEQKWAEEGR
jgi:hypothetical protein